MIKVSFYERRSHTKRDVEIEYSGFLITPDPFNIEYLQFKVVRVNEYLIVSIV